jgi:hypothetical protein
MLTNTNNCFVDDYYLPTFACHNIVSPTDLLDIDWWFVFWLKTKYFYLNLIKIEIIISPLLSFLCPSITVNIVQYFVDWQADVSLIIALLPRIFTRFSVHVREAKMESWIEIQNDFTHLLTRKFQRKWTEHVEATLGILLLHFVIQWKCVHRWWYNAKINRSVQVLVYASLVVFIDYAHTREHVYCVPTC